MKHYQCICCAHRMEAEKVPEECPKCKSNLCFSEVADWRFF